MKQAVPLKTAPALSDILENVSVHLTQLGDQIREIEHEVGQQINANAAPQTVTITQLQNLDYLHQSVKDLSVLMSQLGQIDGLHDVPSAICTKFMRLLQLNDTRALVYPKSVSLGLEEKVSRAGELDLF